MGKIIVPNAVKRREGYIYYIDGQGNLCEAVSVIGKGKKPRTVAKAKAEKTAKVKAKVVKKVVKKVTNKAKAKSPAKKK